MTLLCAPTISMSMSSDFNDMTNIQHTDSCDTRHMPSERLQAGGDLDTVAAKKSNHDQLIEHCTWYRADPGSDSAKQAALMTQGWISYLLIHPREYEHVIMTPLCSSQWNGWEGFVLPTESSRADVTSVSSSVNLTLSVNTLDVSDFSVFTELSLTIKAQSLSSHMWLLFPLKVFDDRVVSHLNMKIMC